MNAISVKDGRMPANTRPAWATPDKLLIPAAMLVVAIGAVLVLPALGISLFGIDNSFWYLSRSSAMVAYFLMWVSLVSGVTITNKLSRVWPGAPTTFEVHKYTSFLGLAFAVVHMLSLLGDTYIGYNLAQILVPFASTQYEPLWVGAGQVGFFLLIPVTLSFYMRKRIGTKGWRTIHGFSYAFFVLALLHSIFSGTDTSTIWAKEFYWFTGIALFGLTLYRIALKYIDNPGKDGARQVVRG